MKASCRVCHNEFSVEDYRVTGVWREHCPMCRRTWQIRELGRYYHSGAYLAQAKDEQGNSFYKIGHSSRFELRLQQLNREAYGGMSNWRPVLLLRCEDGRPAERKLHRVFKQQQVPGEARELFRIDAPLEAIKDEFLEAVTFPNLMEYDKFGPETCEPETLNTIQAKTKSEPVVGEQVTAWLLGISFLVVAALALI